MVFLVSSMYTDRIICRYRCTSDKLMNKFIRPILDLHFACVYGIYGRHSAPLLYRTRETHDSLRLRRMYEIIRKFTAHFQLHSSSFFDSMQWRQQRRSCSATGSWRRWRLCWSNAASGAQWRRVGHASSARTRSSPACRRSPRPPPPLHLRARRRVLRVRTRAASRSSTCSRPMDTRSPASCRSSCALDL